MTTADLTGVEAGAFRITGELERVVRLALGGLEKHTCENPRVKPCVKTHVFRTRGESRDFFYLISWDENEVLELVLTGRW